MKTKPPCKMCGGTRVVEVCLACGCYVDNCECTSDDTLPEIGTDRCPECDDRDVDEERIREYLAERASGG